GFQFDEKLRLRKADHAKQSLDRLHACRVKSAHQHIVVLEHRIYIGRINLQADNIGEGHFRLLEYRHEVVQGENGLCPNVTGVLWVYVSIEGCLASTKQHAGMSLDDLSLVIPIL